MNEITIEKSNMEEVEKELKDDGHYNAFTVGEYGYTEDYCYFTEHRKIGPVLKRVETLLKKVGKANITCLVKDHGGGGYIAVKKISVVA